MVVDDIVVVGAKPLFMTDYIACGKVVPERIAAIVTGIARACAETGTALVGGETAEHPGLMGADDYDVAGAAVGVVEADRLLGADRVRDGDVVHRDRVERPALQRLLARPPHPRERGHRVHRCARPTSATTWGEALLEPTRLYTGPLCASSTTTGSRRRALALARHRRRHRRQPRPRAAARLVGRARPVDLVARARVPRAQRPRRHDPRVDRGHLEPRHRLLRRRRCGCRVRRRRRARQRSGSPRGRRARSRSAPATSTDSSRARRASTAARCGSSARYAG